MATDYVLTCEAATSAPGVPGVVVDTCTAAGGTVLWVESSSALPALSLAEGGLIASAILGLWALGWSFKAIKRHLWEL